MTGIGSKILSGLAAVAVGAALGYAIYGAGYAVGSAKTEARLAKANANAVLSRFSANAEAVLEASKQTRTEIVYKDRFFHTKEKEIEKVIVPLANCPVPDDAVRLWNEAAACAFSGTAAGCGVGGDVQPSR